MIPHTKTTSVTGHLPGEARKFQIDPRATAHMIKMFTNLYSDVELAVIRELSTNALDSHIQAGIADPIEVTTPNAMKSYLTIRDHGVGMSVDELFALFSMYGASTKRESNDVTGMLGIGSKSPLAYGDSFTMISRKDGTEATVAITKDTDGVGQLHVVDTRSTSERNGVEIQVPVKGHNDFERKAKDLFRYWDAGTVLLNGKLVERFNAIEIAPDIWLGKGKTDRYYSPQSIVIQGNVPYPAGELLTAQMLSIPYGYQAIVRLPIGTVDPTPAREGLEQNERTRSALKAVAATFKEKLHASIQAQIENAPTMFDALKTHQEWVNVLGGRHQIVFTHKGKPLPTKISAPTRDTKDRYGYSITEPTGKVHIVGRAASGRNRASRYNAIEPRQMLASMFITDYTVQNFTPTHHAKINQWFARERPSLDADITHYALLDFKADISWLPAERVIDWPTIAAEKLPPKAKIVNTSGRIKGSYDLYLGAGNGRTTTGSTYVQRSPDGVPGSDIDRTHPVYYIHGNQRDAARLSIVLDNFGDKYTIICLPENRLAKFKRDYPGIKNLKGELNVLAQKAVDTMSADQIEALAIDRGGFRADLQYLKDIVSDIADPAIKRAYLLSQVDIKAITQIRDRFAGVVHFPVEPVDSPLNRYRLWDTYECRNDPQHMLRYLNAEYAFQTRAKA